MKTFNFSSKILPQLDFEKFFLSWFFLFCLLFHDFAQVFSCKIHATLFGGKVALYSKSQLFWLSNLSLSLSTNYVYVKKKWNCGVLSKFKSKSYFQKWPLPMVLFLKFVMEKKSNLQLCRYFLFSQFFLNPFAID